MATQSLGSNLLQQLEGCLQEPDLTNHRWSQLVSYSVNSSIQCRKNPAWDQLVPLNYSQSLKFLTLWAWRGLTSWARHYPQCLEKVHLECSVQSMSSLHSWSQLRCSWCRMKAWPKAGCKWSQSCVSSNIPICCRLSMLDNIPSPSIFHPHHSG